ncbi:MAG: hypothetical protein EOP09_09665, partial [Proteobacteria bacterium]
MDLKPFKASANALLPHLEREFLRLKQKNEKFSLRSFARRLGIPASALSEMLAGKRSVTERMKRKLLLRLELSADVLASLEEASSTANPFREVSRDQF